MPCAVICGISSLAASIEGFAHQKCASRCAVAYFLGVRQVGIASKDEIFWVLYADVFD